MKRIQAIFSLFLIILFLATIAFSQKEAKAQAPKAELPVQITSCGQSPGPVMLKVFFMKLKFDFKPKAYEVNTLATAEDLITRKKEGNPFKTLIIVMGASLKGMGAAGTSIDEEIARITKLMEEARHQNMTIIGAHIEGMKRRAQGATIGDNTDELSIDAVAPHSDILLIKKDGNADNRFTIISNEKNIPMIELEKNTDLLSALKNLFQNRDLP